MFDDTISETTCNRFSAVDSVAEQIFDAMPGLGSDAQETALAKQTEASTEPPQTLLTKTERIVGALMQALDERNKALHGEPNAPDISFRAARRRSQLPDGVELLEGAPSVTSENQMMASIRALIEEQEAEQHAAAIEKKREANRRALPSLEPQKDMPRATCKPAPAQRPTLIRRTRAYLRRAFQKDFFLACALSIWSALAMAVFIEPSITGKLFGTSLFLLFVASCLFPDPPAVAKTSRKQRQPHSNED